MTTPFAIGVDLGGTRLRAGLVDRDGVVRRRAEIATDAGGGPDAVVRQIAGLVETIRATVDTASIAGIGVAAPGPLDTATGVALDVATLKGWRDVPLARLLGEALGAPVRIENDGIAAALGEWRHGAGRGLRDFVYVTVSTGIGGGVVCDDRLLRGHRGMAGHVGHMRLGRSPCGSTDNRSWEDDRSWEDIASGTALGRRASREAAAHPGSTLSARGREVTAEDVFAAARSGDALALSLVEEEARWLGLGFVNLLHLYSPERILVGGGVSRGFDLMGSIISSEIARLAIAPFQATPVLPAALGDNSGLVGAACGVFEAT